MLPPKRLAELMGAKELRVKHNPKCVASFHTRVANERDEEIDGVPTNYPDVLPNKALQWARISAGSLSWLSIRAAELGR